MTLPTTDWIVQQEDLWRRLIAGGGKPGVARIEQLTDKTGYEILKAMLSGELPYPPMNDTMNMVLIEVDHGHVVLQGIPLPQYYNPMGAVHGGWFATLLDSAMGCAVQSTLPAGRSYTTAELSLNIVRSALHNTGPLRAVGMVIHGGRQIATASARIEDEQGKLYAHATATCFIFDMPTS